MHSLESGSPWIWNPMMQTFRGSGNSQRWQHYPPRVTIDRCRVSIELKGRMMSDDEGGGMGWLMWIGGLLLINGLSYMFNWGFWLW